MSKNKRSILALISLILGALYLVFIINYFFNAPGKAANSTEAVGVGLAITIVLPHLISVAIAVLMNALGYFMHMRGFVLTGAILYTVAIALFPLYFMFVIIQAILSYIAFARMKKVI